MSLGRRQPQQRELWINTDELAAPPAEPFYTAVNEALADAGFDAFAEKLCAPHYNAVAGRRSLAPGTYFRMLMLAYFEAIDSERGLEWRIADSLSARGFLGIPLTRRVPDQTTISRTRRRLSDEVHVRVLTFIAAMLRGDNLLDGDAIAIDASTIDAAASKASLRRKDTDETYKQWLDRTMREAGIESPTDDDRKRFDRKRKGKRTSNKDWHNPHDPDARIGRTANGRSRMIYKVEHAVDTNSGAIIGARVCSVAGDTTTGPETLERASETLAQLHDAEPDGGPLTGSRVVMDKGYHSAAALVDYEDCGFVPHIKEKSGARRKSRAKRKAQRSARKQSRRKRKSKARSPREREALHRNRRRMQTRVSKRLMKRRAEYVERSFAHTLDRGRLRRTTLRGAENLDKRHQGICAGYNLSRLMHRRRGAGTPKMLAIQLSLFSLMICAVMTMMMLASQTAAGSASRSLRRRAA